VIRGRGAIGGLEMEDGRRGMEGRWGEKVEEEGIGTFFWSWKPT